MRPLAAMLIAIGLALVIAGLVLWFPTTRGFFSFLGRLPGDIRIEREGLQIHFPVVTCIVVSIVLSVLMYLFSRLQ